MGRPATIHINRLEVLRNIANAIAAKREALQADQAALEQRIAAGEQRAPMFAVDWPRYWLNDLQINGIDYDVPTFLGRFPSASERIKTQELIRKLRDDGLIILIGERATRVKLTPAGLASIDAPPVEVAADG